MERRTGSNFREPITRNLKKKPPILHSSPESEEEQLDLDMHSEQRIHKQRWLHLSTMGSWVGARREMNLFKQAGEVLMNWKIFYCENYSF